MTAENDEKTGSPEGPAKLEPLGTKEEEPGSRTHALVLARSVSQLEKLRKSADESESRVIRESLTRAAIVAGLLGFIVGVVELTTPLGAVLAGLLASALTVGIEALLTLPKLHGVEEEFDTNRRATLYPTSNGAVSMTREP